MRYSLRAKHKTINDKQTFIKVIDISRLPWVLTLILAVVSLLAVRYLVRDYTEDVLTPLLFQQAIILDAGHGTFGVSQN